MGEKWPGKSADTFVRGELLWASAANCFYELITSLHASQLHVREATRSIPELPGLPGTMASAYAEKRQLLRCELPVLLQAIHRM